MKKTLILLAIAATAGAAYAESRISASAGAVPLSTSAQLNFEVQVPRILYLRVGDTGATINTVTFTVGLAAPLGSLPINNAEYTATIPPGISGAVATDDDTTGSDGAIPVQLWTNNGTANLGCTSPGLSGTSGTIPLSAITVTQTGSLPHPGGSLDCTTTEVGATGVNSLEGAWTYAFAPTVMPPAGTYSTVVTYTAAQP